MFEIASMKKYLRIFNTRVNLPYKGELSEFCDQRGSLRVLEFNNLNFKAKRFYYLFNSNELNRGGHYHPNLNQIFICFNGSFDIEIKKADYRELFSLQFNNQYLFVPKGYWRELSNFSRDCIIGVFADKNYKETIYIYEEI